MVLKKEESWHTVYQWMLEGQSFSSITIHDICLACDYHRSTFYRLFTDKYDLLDYGIQTLWKDYFSNICLSLLTSPFSWAEEFFQRSNAKKLILSQSSDLELLAYIKKVTFSQLKRAYSERIDSLNNDYDAAYIVATIEFIDDYKKEHSSLFANKDMDLLFRQTIHPDIMMKLQ